MNPCSRCGKPNGPGVSYCQFCGTRIDAPALPVENRCSGCGTSNPGNTNFCQNCGVRLRAAAPPGANGNGRPSAPAFASVAAGVIGGPSGPAAAALHPTPVAAHPATGGYPTPAAPAAAPFEAGVQGPASYPMAGHPMAPDAGRTGGRLIAVRRDGSDGAVYPLAGEQIDIGRAEGDLLFDDPHLARRHARIGVRGGEWTLVPLEARNGVYLRVRTPQELQDGDHVLIGKQVLRFELVADVEKNVRPAVEHGVVYFGTPVKIPWARLRQLTAAGTTRDVYHLSRNDVVLGREQGDIVFSEDEFLSRRHAQVSLRGGRGRLEDLGSSNGTFLRLRGPYALQPGDMIRMGDELLRFERGEAG